jgi:hypothetical protein
MYPKEADTQPGAVVHACNPSTPEPEVGISRVQSHLGIHNEILSQDCHPAPPVPSFHSLDYCLFTRRRYDFQNPSRMDRNVEMFMTIEKSLVQVILRLLS